MSNIEVTSEKEYKVLEWSGGYYFGISCFYIPQLNILDVTKKEDEALRSAFHDILISLDSLKTICVSSIELLYLTTPADNQSFKADVQIFLIVRLCTDSKSDCDQYISVHTDTISRILDSQKIAYKHIDEWDLNSILEPFKYYNAGCLVKEEQIIPSSIPLSDYYYSVNHINSAYDAEAYRSFIHQLSNYPMVAVSFELLPNVFDYEEEESIMKVANLLDRVATGLNDDYYGEIIDYHARKPAEEYNFIYSNLSKPTFNYNIVVFAEDNVSVQIINSIKNLINNSTNSNDRVPLTQIRIMDPEINIFDKFLNYPHIIESELVENYRTQFWLREDAPRSLMRLPYIVTIDEASVFFNLPCVTDETWAGIKVKEKVKERGRIDPSLLDKDNIKIGFRPNDENVLIGIPPLGLTKHMFVAGTPGTGKTNFSQSVLYQAYMRDTNFIVIEPAKSEYRALLGVIPDLQVFTVGNSDISPLLFNPFLPPRNVTVGTYKQELMDVFRAAFKMEGALDNLFLETLNACYLKYGWRDSNTKDDNVEYFGLMEFIHEFEKRMEGKYDKETRSRIKTAGITRLNNLVNKDYVMFDTIQTVSIEDILAKPTVIELDAVGDNEHKSLVTSLLLNNFRSYIRANKDEFTSDGLNSLILLEEAHVIFSAPVFGDSRSASNTIAINLIEGILKELRALGIGMMIADQSPQAVSADVIKMTEHKMVFKTVEKSDRDVLSGAMAMDASLDSEMAEKMAILPVGCGYFFNTQTITPELLQTPNFRGIMNVPVTISDGEVKNNNVYWVNNDNRPYPECKECNICSRCNYKIRDEGRFISNRIMIDYFYSDKCDRAKLKEVLNNFAKLGFNYVDDSIDEQEKILSVKCACVKFFRDLFVKYDLKLTEKVRVDFWESTMKANGID